MKTIIMITALLALSLTPASARIDGDEGGASAYPSWYKNSGGVWISGHRATNGVFVNRPSQR